MVFDLHWTVVKQAVLVVFDQYFFVVKQAVLVVYPLASYALEHVARRERDKDAGFPVRRER